MPTLIIWKNRQIDKLRRDMDRLFDEFWCQFCNPPAPRFLIKMPSIRLEETEERLIIRVDIPAARDLNLSVQGHMLSMQGISNGVPFSRNLRLPPRVTTEDATASYKEETLEIVLNKKAPGKPREYKIKVK